MKSPKPSKTPTAYTKPIQYPQQTPSPSPSPSLSPKRTNPHPQPHPQPTLSNKLDNLLYSQSQYDASDDQQQLTKQLSNVQAKYISNRMLELVENQYDEGDGDGEGGDAGGGGGQRRGRDQGQSIQIGGRDQEDGEGDQYGKGQNQDEQQQQQWQIQQTNKFFFRQIAGNSQQFSQSLSIHRPDQCTPHDSSLNLESITLHQILTQKRKQQQKVNEVLNAEMGDLLERIDKQECLIGGYRKRVEELEDAVERGRKENEELEERVRDYIEKMDKKDQLFNILKMQYSDIVARIDQKDKIERHSQQTIKSLQKQIQKLRNALKTYTDQQKNLLDFNIRPTQPTTTPKLRQAQSMNTRTPQSSFTPNITLRELQTYQAELQKLKRQRKNLETDLQLTKDDLTRKEDKLRNLQQQMKRKVMGKDRKIKDLEGMLQEVREEVGKVKRNGESNVAVVKEKLLKQEKQMGMKQQKLKQAESKLKYALQQIKKKQQKIKQLLLDLTDKTKKTNELKDHLTQQQARNQIQTKLQKQRQNQIDKLSNQIKQLKTEKLALKRQIEGLEARSAGMTGNEGKLRKELEALRKERDGLVREVKEVRECVVGLEREAVGRDQKCRELKKKVDQLTKKTNLNKKKSQQAQSYTQDIQKYKQTISKQNKQLAQLRKKCQHHQQTANKLYILQSRLKYSQPPTPTSTSLPKQSHSAHTDQLLYEQGYQSQQPQGENSFELEEINQALRYELISKENQMQEMRELHQREVQRLVRESKSLGENVGRLEEEILFKEKSLDFMHQKFLELEKENTELRANRNILHSSFYDQSYEHESNSAINFYQNKITTLQKKIQSLTTHLKQSQSQTKKLSSQRESLTFETTQLRSRIKDLQTMAITSEPVRKIAPQSLTQEETVEFLNKLLKRTAKSGEMIRALGRNGEIRGILGGLWRVLEKEGGGGGSGGSGGNMIGGGNMVGGGGGGGNMIGGGKR